MLDLEGRRIKGEKILSVLRELSPLHLEHARVLDVGASTGLIASVIAPQVERLIGLDIDLPAISFAQQHAAHNAHFLLGDAMGLPFRDSSFDVVICTHVYEHVPDAQKLMREIHRILKPQGVCYFAAMNRWGIVEPHYRLPFLSWLSPAFASLLLRLLRRGSHYYERPLGYSGLLKLTSDFHVVDATAAILEDPARFHASDVITPGSWKHRLSKAIYRFFPFLSPGYVWVLTPKASST